MGAIDTGYQCLYCLNKVLMNQVSRLAAVWLSTSRCMYDMGLFSQLIWTWIANLIPVTILTLINVLGKLIFPCVH